MCDVPDAYQLGRQHYSGHMHAGECNDGFEANPGGQSKPAKPTCTAHEVLQGNKCDGCGNNNEPVCGNGAPTAATVHDAWRMV